MDTSTFIKVTKQIPKWLLIFLSLFPLLNIKLISIAVFLFYFFSIVFNFKKIKSNFKNYGFKPLLINSLFYLFIILSITYSPFKAKGLELVIREVSFLLMPLVIIYALKISKSLIKIMSIVYVLSNVLVVVYFTFKLNLLNIFLESPINFFNRRFFLEIGATDYKDWHATYIALNFLISIILIINFIFKSQAKVIKLFATLVVFFLLAFLLILNSRIIIALASLVVPVYIFFKIKGFWAKTIMTILVLVLMTSLFFISNNNKLGRLFVEPVSYYISNFNTKTLLGVRYEVQKCSFELITKKPLLGYGVGYEKKLLPSYCLEVKNFKNQYLKKYSSHNVYLSIFFNTGVFGFIALIYLLGNNLYLTIKNRKLLYASILVVFIFAFITENYFIRINGVLLFAFLNSYFYKQNMKVIE